MSQETNQPQEIPVYLFTGFLESGKTKFIQGILEDSTFGTDERTLVLVCEEGEEEYDPERFHGANNYIRTVEKEDALTEAQFKKWEKEIGYERVVVEYNGTWMLDTLYTALPENYLVYQEFMFAETATFENFNANMRQLVYDKLKSCQIIVFNRFPAGMDYMPLHRIVRGVNRQCDIAYEQIDGTAQYDEIEDPLPFDKTASTIEIEDKDYALWYRDLGEDLESYNGKTVSLLVQINKSKNFPSDMIVVGRPIMNCCAADTTFAGIVAEGYQQKAVRNEAWARLTAKIRIEWHPMYQKEGPVLEVLSLKNAPKPEDPVATFY